MIDTIKTLKNLNKKFPRFQLNTLFEILDCIEEKPELTTIPWEAPTYTPPTITPLTITCTDTSPHECKDLNACENTISTYGNTISACDNQMLFEPKKHHVKDKTSKNVRILTEEAPADDDDEMDMENIELLYKETVDLLHDYLSKLDVNEILK